MAAHSGRHRPRIVVAVIPCSNCRLDIIVQFSFLSISTVRLCANFGRSKDPGPEDPALSSPQRGGVYLGLQME
ncbi:hypothetical protein D1AOALGA4SA_8040 [Olavius algarvensis Delta 1 endosymbiont]|nr:hypothetical protein D1AOALGA4SA_8040 [Olavius algarvensis Delta 1 endosymbiont]